MSQEAMNPQTARKLLEVGEAFRIPGPFFSYEEIKMGNVNHTYKVNYIRDDGTGMAKVKSYLVQRVNTYAFQRPVELMKNIDGAHPPKASRRAVSALSSHTGRVQLSV